MEFEHSDKVKELSARLQDFMDAHVFPVEHEYVQNFEAAENKWTTPPLMRALQAKAREAGLWNLFLPDAQAAFDGYLDWVQANTATQPSELAATADRYLRSIGTILGAALLARMTRKVGTPDDAGPALSKIAEHFILSHVPQAAACLRHAEATAQPIASFEPEWLRA